LKIDKKPFKKMLNHQLHDVLATLHACQEDNIGVDGSERSVVVTTCKFFNI